MRFILLLLLLISGGLGYWFHESYRKEAGIPELQLKIRQAGSDLERIDSDMKRVHDEILKLDKALAEKKEEFVEQRNIQEVAIQGKRGKLIQKQKSLDEHRLLVDKKYKKLQESLNDKIQSLRGELDATIAKDREAIFNRERRENNVSHASKVNPNWPAQKARLVANMNAKHDRLKKIQEKEENKLIFQLEQAEKTYRAFQAKNNRNQQEISREIDNLSSIQQEADETTSFQHTKNPVPSVSSPLLQKRTDLALQQKKLQNKYDILNREANYKMQKALEEKEAKLANIKTWTYIICGFWGLLTLFAFSGSSRREA